jgi:hypothetical protein
MNYKNAFKCKNCPESNSKDGCPCWVELLMVEDDTGKQRVDKACVFSMLPMLMVETIKAVQQPAHEISAMRGQVAHGVERAMLRIPEIVEARKRLND